MLGNHRIRHHPIGTNRQAQRPPPNDTHSLSQPRIKGSKARTKTQSDQPILPSYSTPARRHSLWDTKDRPQKGYFCPTPLQRQLGSKKAELERLQVRLPRAQQFKKLMGKLEKKESPKACQSHPQTTSLQRNILNLAGVCNALLRSTSQTEITASIKRYILEERSALDDLEEGQPDTYGQTFKSVLFYERVAMIAIIECMLVRRKLGSVIFTQLIKEIIGFYSYLYDEWTGSSLQQFLIKRGKGYAVGSANYGSAMTHGSMVGKRMVSLLKQHPQLDNFVKEQVKTIGTISGRTLYNRLLEFYAQKLASTDYTVKGIQFLQTCPAPYLKDSTARKYTLLLDLDQTLAHYRVTAVNKGEFLLRPYVFEFVQRMAQHYEVGIFTCALSDYADIVLDHLKSLSFRLYRQHALRVNGELVKDLSRVGRDLSRLILVDNLASNFRFQPKNGIHVRSWFGEQEDNLLVELAMQLESIIKESPADIRHSKHRRSFQ